MGKLTQHGGFDPALESAVREELLAEFTEWSSEDFGEVMDAFDFAQLCQRKDGSVYGTQGQCRKGTPVSIGSKDNALALRKKALERGLKHKDVNEIYAALRSKYGQKQLRGEKMIQSLAKRINQRLGLDDIRPESIKIGSETMRSMERDVAKELSRMAQGERSLKQLGTRSLENEQLKPGSRGLAARREMVRRALGTKNVPPAKPKSESKPKTESSEPRKAAGPQVDIVRRKEGGIHDIMVDGKRVGQMLKLPGDPRYQIDVNGKQDRVTGLAMARARARALAKEQAAPKPAAKGNFEKWKQEREKALATGNLSGGVKGYNANTEYAKNSKVLGKGAMGEVKETSGPPPGVVKKGMIGQNEVAALKRLEETGITPKFHGGAVTGRERKVSGGLGGHVTEQRGIIGMSKVDGVPYSAARVGMTKAQREQALDEYIRVRREIHTRNVAHNDMHSGNYFYDKKSGKGGLVDFGLAQISPRAALVEALGTTNGRDWQASGVNPTGTDTPIAKRLTQNIRNVRAELRLLGVDTLPDIRSNDKKLESVFGGKVSDKEAERLIRMVYDGI